MTLKNLDRETEIICCIVNDKAILLEDIDLNDLNWMNLLRRASSNRILYQFSDAFLRIQLNNLQSSSTEILLTKRLETIISCGNLYLNKLIKTLEFINSFFSNRGISYLIIKTFRTHPYVTFDVDVLVKSDHLRNIGNELKHVLQESNLNETGFQMHIKPRGLLTIDMHIGSFWENDVYIDEEFVWKKQRIQDIQGITCPVPSIDAEITLTICHILHERLHITLLEFELIKYYCKKIDWNSILEQAEKNGWRKSFLRFLSIMNSLNKRIYPMENETLINELQFKSKNIIIPKTFIGYRLGMPYLYPFPYGLEIFIERIQNKNYSRIFKVFPYYVYATLRYYFTKKTRTPIYDHWFNFKQRDIK